MIKIFPLNRISTFLKAGWLHDEQTSENVSNMVLIIENVRMEHQKEHEFSPVRCHILSSCVINSNSIIKKITFKFKNITIFDIRYVMF